MDYYYLAYRNRGLELQNISNRIYETRAGQARDKSGLTYLRYINPLALFAMTYIYNKS